MSGDRGSCLQTKVTQDPGLPFGYVSNSECDGIFNHLDYCVYKHVLLHKCCQTCVIRSTDGVIVHQADVHRLDIDTSICTCRIPQEFAEIGASLCGELLLIPLAVTIVLLGTDCRGYSTYKNDQIIFIIIFAVLVIVSFYILSLSHC